MKSRFKWGIVVFLTLFVLFEAISPPSGIGSGILYIDKVYHLGFFFVYGLAVMGALRGRLAARELFLITVLSTLALGAFSEALQSITPGRSVEALDVVADVTGGMLAMLVGIATLAKCRKNKCAKVE